MVALGGHLEFALRNAIVPGIKRSWELVEWPKTLLDYKPAVLVGSLPLVRAPALVATPVASAEPDSAISGLQPKRLKSDLTWEKKLQAREIAAFRKWSGIIRFSPCSFDVGRRLEQDGEQSEAVSGYLRHIFAGRSSETLHNRASPMLRYIAWHTRKWTQAFPLTESDVYAFCVEHEQKGSPTFLKSFISSMNFCLRVMGLTEAKDVLSSARIQGAARAAFLKKRRTLRRPALTAAMVRVLEEMIISKNATPADRVCAGFFLICIYMRARLSDGLNMGEFFVDQPGGDSVGLEGYIGPH